MIPFLSVPKEKAVLVGSPSIGTLYFRSIGSRTALERKYLDALDQVIAKSQLFLLELAQKISVQESLAVENALAAITTGSDAALISKYSSDIDKLKSYKYKADKLRELIAVVMIQQRILYPVKLAKAAKQKDESITVESLSFPIEVRDILKFGNQKVEVHSSYDPISDTVTLNCEPLSAPISSGTIGFLCNSDGSLRCGSAEFGEIPDDVFGALSVTPLTFKHCVENFSNPYREIAQTLYGQNPEFEVSDLVLAFRTKDVQSLSTELLDEIEAFYNQETSGDAEGKKEQ